MKLRTLLPTLLLAAAAPAGAVDMTSATPPDGLVALLDVPTLFGSGPCTPRPGAKYPLRSAPDARAAVVGTLEAMPIPAGQTACSQDALAPRVRKPGDTWTSPVPTREFAAGHPGLIVTDLQPGWYRIMLGDGEAWFAIQLYSGLHNYRDLVTRGPIHTLRGWDGRVCSSPRIDDCRRMAMPANRTLRINRAQAVGADQWFQVEFGISACEGATPPGRDVLSGWIPGFGPPGPNGKRALTVWMDPRGC